MDELKKRLTKFRDDRDWRQFHTPENLAKSITIEAAELLEHFQWDGTFNKDEVSDELADVMSYCLLMADVLDIDLEGAIHQKIDKNEIKYPADQCKGSSKKYTEYKKKSASS